MSDDHTEVTVAVIPKCDLCKLEVNEGKRSNDQIQDAWCDGKTQMGPWGYMCHDHFCRLGVGLGLGLGQRLVLPPKLPDDPFGVREQMFGTLGDVMRHKQNRQRSR